MLGEAGLSKAQDTSHIRGYSPEIGGGSLFVELCRALSSVSGGDGRRGRWPPGIRTRLPGTISQLYRWKRGISLLGGLRVSRVGDYNAPIKAVSWPGTSSYWCVAVDCGALLACLCL